MIGRVGIADLGLDSESPSRLLVLCTCEDWMMTGLDLLSLTKIGQGGVERQGRLHYWSEIVSFVMTSQSIRALTN